ncbi:DUF6119 family protein [Plantactinospora siamensis]|uniref:DUF6119 family protein n=1 Tax=Plantactinospora siamensis TaxID=555372 RepID=A0ABV6P1M9_9ACTN
MHRTQRHRTGGGPTHRPPTRTDQSRPTTDPPPSEADPPEPPPAVGPSSVRPRDTYRTTLYRLDRVPPSKEGLAEALNSEYLADRDISIEERRIADAPALVVRGIVRCDRADWCDPLDRMTGRAPDIGHASAGCAVVIAVDDQVYALTYGALGRFLVDTSLASPDFGLAFAVRSVSPQKIRQVRRKVFGTGGRVDRNLVPSGQHIRWYGIDKWGEIVGQLAGPIVNPRLTACGPAGRSTSISGGTSLGIDLGVEPPDLLADLREIARVCRRESPLADLEFVTQIRPIQRGDARLADVTGRLDKLLGQAEPDGVGLAVPGDLVDRIEDARAYRLRVAYAGRKPAVVADLALDDILAQTREAPAGQRWDGLRKGRIGLYADAAGRDELGSAPADRWLTAQLAHGASQLFLHEGRWYEIGERHLEFLQAEIAEILARPTAVALPPWPVGMEEKDYNDLAAGASGYVPLDRRLLRTAQHPRGIEGADLLGPGGELIHVKRASGSAPLSHLFAQGVVAVDALKYERDARARLVERVRAERPRHWLGLDFRPHTVVYAIALDRGRALTAGSFFTFAQVALYRAVKALRAENVDVQVVGIPSS